MDGDQVQKEVPAAENKPCRPKRDNCGDAGLFIPAGLFLGLGWGFLAGNVVAGVFLGLGLGFLGMAIATACARRPGGKP